MSSAYKYSPVRMSQPYKDETKNLWVCVVHYTDPTGHRKKKSISSRNKKSCLDKSRKFRDSMLLNSPQVSEKSVTVKSFADNWMETTQEMALKPTTYLRKQQILKYQVYPYIGNIPISELSLFNIQHMVNQIDKSGLSYSAVKKAIDCTRQIVNYYCVVAKTNIDPLRGVQLPTRKKRSISDIVFFSTEECKRIINAATEIDRFGKPVYRLGYSIVVLIFTGLRIGELLGLRWREVDFENNIITITGNAVSCQVDGKYIMIRQDSPKTDSSNRVIPLAPPAKEAFQKLFEVTGSKEFVMTNELNEIFSYNHANRMFHAILKRCNIKVPKGTGIHSLRHTFASLLFDNDVDVKTVSELLGHCETGITEDIYIHITNRRKALAMKPLGNILEGK